jgi:hypothetical protein
MSQLPLEAHSAQIPICKLLVGWNESEQKLRFPVTFAVERETERIWSLRIVPAGIAQLASALAVPAADRLLLLSGGGVGAVYAPRVGDGAPLVPATLLPRLRAPVELIHVARGRAGSIQPDAVPTTLLGDPEAALPEAWGSRFAVSIQDGCHGVIYAHDRSLLRACLRSYLGAYQRAVLGAEQPLPAMPDALLDPLLEPMSPDAYVEASFVPGERFWTMELRMLTAGSETPLAESTRWVCEAVDGSWRDGWAW